MLATQVTPVVTDHGEGPACSPRWSGPRWVDMLAGDICELQPDGAIRRRHVDTIAAMIRPRTSGGFVVAGERQLHLAAEDDLDAPMRALPPIFESSGVRMNEGGCDPSGQLYLGSMAYDNRTGGGKLYSINDQLEAVVVEDSVTTSNGIDWSPDGHTCYYVDSGTHRVDRYDWNAATGLSNRRPFLDIAGPGIPDGLTIDTDGQIWVAIFGGGRVLCYSPDGTLQQVIEVPATQVTAATFAGNSLTELLITTSRYNLGANAEAGAGALYRAHPGVQGQPTKAFYA